MQVPNLHETGVNDKRRIWPVNVRRLAAEMDRIAPAGDLGLRDTDGLSEADRKRLRDLYDERRVAMEEAIKADPSLSKARIKDPFVNSQHFSTPNIVVHARVKDRTGANGEKVLFVEEIQSDLATKWREANEAPEITARRLELDAELKAIDKEREAIWEDAKQVVLADMNPSEGLAHRARMVAGAKLFDFYMEMKAYAEPVSEDGKAAGRALLKGDDKLYHKLIDLGERERTTQREQIALGIDKSAPATLPDTPFKGEASYTLMVKRLLRMAAEEGYSKLAWTPGYMQALRWMHGEEVAANVSWTDTDAGGRMVHVAMLDARRVSATVSPQGIIEFVQDEDNGQQTQFTGKPLAALIGPRASKVMAEPEGKVTGKFSLADTGYSIAYDQQTRKAVDKFARKYGSRVVEDKTLPDFMTDPSGADAVWSIEITPELRAAALEPQPILRADAVTEADIGRELKADFQAMANAELEAAGIAHKVRARMAPVLMQIPSGEFMTVSGSYRAGDIKVSPMPGKQAIDVLHHEIIHALRDSNLWHRDYGLFDASEWRALARAARAHPGIMEKIEAQYPNLSTAAKTEEAVAELYRLWRRGDATYDMANYGRIEPIMQRIRAFFEAMGNALRGLGFVSHGEIFARIASGELSARTQARNDDGTFMSQQAKFMADYVNQPDAKTPREAEVRERKFLGNLLTQAMQGSDGWNLLSLVPGQPLMTELAANLPAAREYLRHRQKMDKIRNDWISTADKTAKEWWKIGRKDREANKAMMDLMHEATTAEQDPSRPYSAKTRLDQGDFIWAPELATIEDEDAQLSALDQKRRAAYADLRDKWEKLPSPFKSMFSRTFKDFSDMAAAQEQAVINMAKKSMDLSMKRAKEKHRKAVQAVKDEGLRGDERTEAMQKADADLRRAHAMHRLNQRARLAALRRQFEANRIAGYYAPLSRFGNFFVTVRDKNTGEVVSFSKFEKAKKQDAFAKEMRQNADYEVETGVISVETGHRSQVNPNFVADVEEIVGGVVTDPKVMDEIWQRYLQSLPDLSVRKSRIHRKGTPGYDKDAFRAYARQMFHAAHQLARMEKSMDLEDALDEMKAQAQQAEDPNRSGLVVNEIILRHEHVVNPKGSAAAQMLTSAAFVYYLGFAPSSAVVNLTQTTVVGTPILAAGFKKGGVLRAGAALSGALRDFAGGVGDVRRAKRLTSDERAAMDQAYELGIIDRSESHDLAAIETTGFDYKAGWQSAMTAVSWMFHQAEVLNREVTFLAAYRMAVENGFTGEHAIERAGDLTWDIHFNYERSSRPRFMQSDWARVFLVFRNFQINMVYRFARDLHQSFAGKTPDARAQARKQFLGVTASMMFHAGVRGTWGLAMVTAIWALVSGDDEDEIANDLQKSVVDLFGAQAGGMILNGVPGHVLGIDLTSRIGMPELWFRKSDRMLEGEDAYNYWLSELAGATAGIGENLYKGSARVREGIERGQPWTAYRGVETMMPKAVRDLMQGYRFQAQGAQTYAGSDYIQDLTPHEVLVKTLGFQPARLSERYRLNTYLYNEQDRIRGRSSDILSRVRDDIRAEGTITQKTIDMIAEFNLLHPGYMIDNAKIKTSLKASDRDRATRENGVNLIRGLDAEIRGRGAPAVYD